MATLDEWFERYGASHRHPVNQALHTICVPLITVALVALLTYVPIPGTQRLTLGGLLLLAALLGYARVAPRHAIGMAVIAAALAWMWPRLAPHLGVVPLLVMFVLAWIGQFVGHKIEGKKPSFFDDLRFLFIGPLWVLDGIYRRLGLTRR